MMAIPITVFFVRMRPVHELALLFLAGIPIYIWGCIELARAKGQSTAIVLTVFLGILFPLVVLLALPDKNKYHRHHSR